ncbi:acetyl-CoA carboxylase biotin carboxylase subunit [Candidatus Fermentibacterales bacterium]|nr:acetyl-CoA carboxylase biotin carboxylase subunit [Candidatus Fermentibacterales bacterium]
MISKILVANRGEIAVRVMRACRELDITSVAVYSEVDRAAKHVRYADEAYEIGPAPSRESYLRIDKIMDVARRSGADAIHPGYGFLAENPELPAACEEQGIIFIGPGSESMALVGDKTRARETVESVGIPIVPGIKEPLQSSEQAIAVAKAIGYPVMLKASGGGGGKGVRIVENDQDLPGALERARAEAVSAFNNPDVYLEKYLVRPRHVEVQVVADAHGNVVHLNERECSVQRRYQKLIEESPSCALTPELRRQMGEAAIRAIRASGYVNAGTVEFLVDSERNFYFLEVNARLQVEHPVTELITGLDLVKLQILVAGGQKLPMTQKQVRINGAAIECRISAEDPQTFLPSTGIIEELIEPAGPGVRVESGISVGYEVPIYYDPLVAKLITWGADRAEALSRMDRALKEYKIRGILTTIPFHQKALRFGPFLEGDYHTGMVSEIEHTETSEHIEIAAMAATIVAMAESRVDLQPGEKGAGSQWRMSGRANGGLYRIGW